MQATTATQPRAIPVPSRTGESRLSLRNSNFDTYLFLHSLANNGSVSKIQICSKGIPIPKLSFPSLHQPNFFTMLQTFFLLPRNSYNLIQICLHIFGDKEVRQDTALAPTLSPSCHQLSQPHLSGPPRSDLRSPQLHQHGSRRCHQEEEDEAQASK